MGALRRLTALVFFFFICKNICVHIMQETSSLLALASCENGDVALQCQVNLY